jgi:hypothetical protein
MSSSRRPWPRTQVTISNAFANELSNEFPQVTRGLSNERLVRLSERVCITLRDGDVPGLGDELASANSIFGGEDDAETAAQAEAKTDAEAEKEGARFKQGAGRRRGLRTAQGRGAGADRDRHRREDLDPGRRLHRAAGLRRKRPGNRNSNVTDAAAQLSAQFQEETRGLSEDAPEETWSMTCACKTTSRRRAADPAGGGDGTPMRPVTAQMRRIWRLGVSRRRACRPGG